MAELLPCPHHEDAIYPNEICQSMGGPGMPGYSLVAYMCPECGYRISDTGKTPEEARENAARGWNERYVPTCTVEYSESAVMDHMHLYRWWRLSCGHEMMTATEPPRYCEECGAKVVDE